MLKRLNARWFYVTIRLIFAALFFWVGFTFEDGRVAYIFSALFVITAIMKPRGCIGNCCKQ